MRVILICSLLLFCSACTVTPQQQDQAVIAIEKNLPQLVSSLTKLGLTQWAKKDAPAAKEGAKLIAQNVRTVALPYFTGSALPLSQAAQNILKAIGDTVPPAASNVIVVVVATIQAAISIPSTDEYMTERQRTDVVVGLTALAEACEKFVK